MGKIQMTTHAEGDLMTWPAGNVPVAIVMISLNEAHHMNDTLVNLRDFAQEVFLVDSYSSDDTVDIALAHGVRVVQRPFLGFGDQWSFALSELPITAPWTMKLDPDERLTDELKQSIATIVSQNAADAFNVNLRLWFMGRPLPVRQMILRGWRTGSCRFSDVSVNEHPLVDGRVIDTEGDLEHRDSPDLHHWFDKQNRYSSAEALSTYRGDPLSAPTKFFGNSLERRMWLKSKLTNMPLQYSFVFLYCYILQGAWRAGRVGLIWASMRANVYRMWSLKVLEMRLTGKELYLPSPRIGKPHLGAVQR